MRKSLLFLTSVPPSLSGSGTAMRAGAHLRALASAFEVTLVVLDSEDPAESTCAVGEDIRGLCAEVIVVARQSSFRSLWKRCSGRQVRTLLEGVWPWPTKWAFNAAALRHAARLLAGRRFDTVHCFRLQNAALLSMLDRHRIGHGQVTLDLDDYESFALLRTVRDFRAALGLQYSLIRRLDAMKWSILESIFVPRFAAVMVCSALDRDRLSRRFPRTRFEVVPNVVSTPAWLPGAEHSRFTFLFVGALNYEPNRDAIHFFCSQVLPILRRKAGTAFRLLIVGRHPDASVLALGELEEVEVVDSPPEVAPYYAEADVAVAPIRSGGGTRIKIIEAFSFGLPVVATTVGAEGLDLVPGRDLLIADDAEGLADHCLALISQERTRQALAAAGRQVFATRFSDSILPDLFGRVFAG